MDCTIEGLLKKMFLKTDSEIYGEEGTSINFPQKEGNDTAIFISPYFVLGKDRFPLSNLVKLVYENEDIPTEEIQDIMLYTLNTHSILL